MVQNNEIQDEVEESLDTVAAESLPTDTKKGRGRPAGSTNKPNEEVVELRKEIHELKNRIDALASGSGTSRLDTANSEGRMKASVDKLDVRLSIIQQYTEMFHLFLTTGRITNSTEKTAADELEKVISTLPEQVYPLSVGVDVEAES